MRFANASSGLIADRKMGGIKMGKIPNLSKSGDIQIWGHLVGFNGIWEKEYRVPFPERACVVKAGMPMARTPDLLDQAALRATFTDDCEPKDRMSRWSKAGFAVLAALRRRKP